MPDYAKVTVADLPDAPNPTRHKKELDEAVGEDYVLSCASCGKQVDRLVAGPE